MIYVKIKLKVGIVCMKNLFDKNDLLKASLIYLIYFVYSYIAGMISVALKIENDIFIIWIFDILFFLLVLYAYRQELQIDLKKLKEKYTVTKIIKNVAIGVGLLILLNIIMGMLADWILPGKEIDSNTKTIVTLFKTAPLYATFKTLVFAPIAEEILFRKSLSHVIKNDYLFVLVTAIIYTIMNFIFVGASSINLNQILIYFMPALLFSGIYVKNNRNIYIVMIVKFIMQFIPFIMLITK